MVFFLGINTITFTNVHTNKHTHIAPVIGANIVAIMGASFMLPPHKTTTKQLVVVLRGGSDCT